jgi:hypothetical protein
MKKTEPILNSVSIDHNVYLDKNNNQIAGAKSQKVYMSWSTSVIQARQLVHGSILGKLLPDGLLCSHLGSDLRPLRLLGASALQLLRKCSGSAVTSGKYTISSAHSHSGRYPYVGTRT